MNENLNLIEILKDVPKGTKLWSPVFGDCKFVKIKENNSNYPIVCTIKIKWLTDSKEYAYFSSKGELCIDYNNTECILFPSKENRDWSAFKVSKKHKVFKPYQKVLVKELVGRNFDKLVWLATDYSHYDEDLKQHYCTMCYGFDDDAIIPYEGNEDKVGTIAK